MIKLSRILSPGLRYRSFPAKVYKLIMNVVISFLIHLRQLSVLPQYPSLYSQSSLPIVFPPFLRMSA